MTPSTPLPEQKMTIHEMKEYILENGGLRQRETVGSALKRIEAEKFEKSRMASVFASTYDCHTCTCHINPPCNQCVECKTCEERNNL